MANQETTQEKKEHAEPQGYYRYDVGKGVSLFLSVKEKHEAQKRQSKTYWKDNIGGWVRGSGIGARRYSNVVIMLATVVNLVVAGLQWSTMTEETAANKKSAQAALDQLHSQRPYVSLGRPDGAIAKYKSPPEGISKGSITLYFQNTGIIAATYFLVNFESFFNPDVRIDERHIERSRAFHENRPFGKSFINGKTLGANSTHVEILDPKLVPTVDEWTLIDAGQMEPSFSLLGNVEYCDPWGVFHCEEFHIRYVPSPVRRFVSEFNRACEGWPVHPDPKTLAVGEGYRAEIMARCEQPEERIARENQLQ